MSKKYLFVVLACILVIGIIGIPAVHGGSTSGVIFYQDANWQGVGSQIIQPGNYTMAQLNALTCPNDWMSSLKVPTGWTVVAYQNDNFTGTTWTFTDDTSYVGAACNDQMTSCKITVGGGGPTPTPGGGGGTLVWSDEFNSTSLNRSNWNYQIGNGFNPGAGYFDGWGNGEWEWYRQENVSVNGSNLVIKGEYLSTPVTLQGRQWYQFSGRITTKGLKSWQYGKVEASIKLPTAQATWPAFWMMGNACDTTVNGAAGGYDKLPTNWASCGELDIMEHKNADTQFCSNFFYDTRIGVYPWASSVVNNPTWTTGIDVTQYHTYGFQWNSTTLTWYIDGRVIKTQDCSASNMEEFRQPFFIILNLAIAGQFTGTTPVQSQFPCYMYVDWVRVYQ